MKESIVIKNFGPIKKVVIDDIKPMTVFIGESGSGKSTIMKVLALFQWLYKKVCIISYLKYSGIPNPRVILPIHISLIRNGLKQYVNKDTLVIYKNGSYTLTYMDARLTTSEKFVPQEELSLEKIAFISDKRNLIADIVENIDILRSFYFKETYRDYMKACEAIRNLSIDYLGIKFNFERKGAERKYVISSTNEDGEYRIDMRSSSSGIQNVVPLMLNIEYFTKYYDLIDSMNKAIYSYLSELDDIANFRPITNMGDIANKRIRIFIEEPELSLYPDSQLLLMDYIVDSCFVHGPTKYSMNLMMATHSPYIVNYLNVLLKRGKESGKAYIAAGELAVYCVHQGEVQNLMMQHNVTGEYYVNTMDLSDAMCAINNEYQMLKNKDTDVLDRE